MSAGYASGVSRKKPPRGEEPYLISLALRDDVFPLPKGYPFNLPVVAHLELLEFHPKVTYFVGENGTGKSTLLEAIAIAAGFNAEGGSKGFQFSTKDTHSDLHDYLRLRRGLVREHDGFFLRAESYYNVATEIERKEGKVRPEPTYREKQLKTALSGAYDVLDVLNRQSYAVDEELMAEIRLTLDPPDLFCPTSISHAYGGPPHEKSHGEAFLALAEHRFRSDSLFILDEPEAALSPARQLAILLRIHDLVRTGSCQFIIATHSPILMSYPNSKMFFLDEAGIRETTWKETEHYQLTKSFLDRPEVFLHHLLESESCG
jgi:predicted ATPase